MRYILHIGLPKAGSTSIQAFLRANGKRLRAQSILYPLGGLNGHGSNQAWIGKVLAQEPERVATFARSLKGAAETVILSGEHFIQRDQAWIARLREVLETEVGPGAFQVIVYFRNLPDQVLSRCAQEAKTGYKLYADFIHSEFGGRSPRREIRNWEAVFGADAVDVRLLEAAGSLPQDFMAAAGLPWREDYVLPPRENVSPDPITAQTLALLRREFGVSHRSSRVVEAGWKLPRLENQYLAEIAEVVAHMKLKHPKLERFGADLTEVRWRDETRTPDLGEYLGALIRSLQAIKEEG
jgi:hypothetical protein